MKSKPLSVDAWLKANYPDEDLGGTHYSLECVNNYSKYYANWKSQQPTTPSSTNSIVQKMHIATSTTIDELAEGFEQMAFNEGFRDDILKDIVNLMQAAYNLRDKEQAGAAELVEGKIKELSEKRDAIGGGHGISKGIISTVIDELTHLLSLIKQ